MILAGDIGGTKTLLGLFGPAGRRLRSVRERSFPSQEYASLEAMAMAFLAEGKEEPSRCAVGVAGPVVAGRSHVVNLEWPVDARHLARALHVREAHVLNDLEATAWGLPHVPPRKMVSLTPGIRPGVGNSALIAAGTGLGMAILVWDGARHVPSASEGGHQGFPPRDDLEIELLRYLRRELGRVSLERIVAGPGLSAIYRFLVETGRSAGSARTRERMAGSDPNAAVAAAGATGEDAAAARAVDLFVSLYGSAAGDLALVSRAVGGVYLGGGIAPKLLGKLREGEFVRAFRDKGRLAPFLEKIPIRVVLEPRTALLGAAARAAHGASD